MAYHYLWTHNELKMNIFKQTNEGENKKKCTDRFLCNSIKVSDSRAYHTIASADLLFLSCRANLMSIERWLDRMKNSQFSFISVYVFIGPSNLPNFFFLFWFFIGTYYLPRSKVKAVFGIKNLSASQRRAAGKKNETTFLFRLFLEERRRAEQFHSLCELGWNDGQS